MGTQISIFFFLNNVTELLVIIMLTHVF